MQWGGNDGVAVVFSRSPDGEDRAAADMPKHPSQRRLSLIVEVALRLACYLVFGRGIVRRVQIIGTGARSCAVRF